MLDATVGQKSPYRPWNTCRNYSFEQWGAVKAMGIGTPETTPGRVIMSNQASCNLWFGPSSTVASDANNWTHMPFQATSSK